MFNLNLLSRYVICLNLELLKTKQLILSLNSQNLKLNLFTRTKPM